MYTYEERIRAVRLDEHRHARAMASTDKHCAGAVGLRALPRFCRTR